MQHQGGKKWLILVVAMVFVVSLATVVGAENAKSVILMIGDGMGPAEVDLARLYKGGGLVMDSLPVKGSATNASANAAVTDSAAAATALATGFKTNNGMIAVTPDGKPRKTLLEAAGAAGKATGVITTTRISHATPACFIAHVDARADETTIVTQALVTKPDLMLGGGEAEFLDKSLGGNRKDGRNMVAEAEAAGYHVVRTLEQLQQAPSGRLLGLFQPSYMSYEIDRKAGEPSLAEMTDVAIQRLATDHDGFFLMVEGGRIDNAGHNNDAASSVRETLAFDAAVQVALDYVLTHPDTLLVVTADHETGGLSVNTNDHQVVAVALGKATASSETLTGLIMANRSNYRELATKYTGLSEITALEDYLLRSLTKAADIRTAVGNLLNTRAKVRWSTTGHTGVPVPVGAAGVGSTQFSGQFANTEVARRIAALLAVPLD